MRDPTLHFLQIIDYNELNQSEKIRNFKKIGSVKVKRFRFFLCLLIITKISDVAAQIDLSIYLSFDTKMNSVGPTGAELWVFVFCGLSYVGQTLATHILDCIQP